MSEPTVDIEDRASLVAYLRRFRIAESEMPEIRVLAGGVSNKTVLVERPDGEAWVLKQALPKLRTKADWFSDPSRIRREAEALRWLPQLAPQSSITPLVFEDPDQYLLAMEAVPRPHENLKALLLSGDVRDDHMRQFGGLLGRIHERAVRSDHVKAIRSAFIDRTFFESLRIEPYYLYTASQVPDAAAFYVALVEETRASLQTLVHGDYSPKNVLVTADDQLVLLDHEVAHWGDPAFDVGFALTHLLSKANHRRANRDTYARAADTFWDAYWLAVRGPFWAGDVSSRAVRHTLGCLLARVAGRSPLEYLTKEKQRRQAAVAIELMARPPESVTDLTAEFVKRI